MFIDTSFGRQQAIKFISYASKRLIHEIICNGIQGVDAYGLFTCNAMI